MVHGVIALSVAALDPGVPGKMSIGSEVRNQQNLIIKI